MREYSKGSIKIKVSNRQIILATFLVLLISTGIYVYFQIPQPIKYYEYKGVPIFFRQDLREAAKIEVRPFENGPRLTLLNPLVTNITFVFIPASEGQNGIYLVEEVEIIQKLTVAFAKDGIPLPGFKAVNVTSYENLSGKIQNPIIALVHPEYSNETVVQATTDHVVYIKGKTFKEFDLATVRFLMSIFSINI